MNHASSASTTTITVTPSALGGSEHHRRLNSVKSRQDNAMYSTPPPKLAHHQLSRNQDSHRLAQWKYPAASTPSTVCSEEESPIESPCASTASSPSLSPETHPRPSNWQHGLPKLSTGSPPTGSTRASGHRFSPSLPYHPFTSQSQSAAAVQSQQPQQPRVRHQSASSLFASRQLYSRAPVSGRLMGSSRLILNALRRTKPIEVAYGFVFFASFVVFAAALAGVGYVPPPDKVAMPLTTQAVTTHRPAVRPSTMPIAYGQPAAAANFEIPARAALPPLDLKQGVKPLRAAAAVNVEPLVIREDDDVDDVDELPAWAQHRDDTPVQPAPVPPAHADDLVKASPNDALLNDEHAAHVHHPAEENIYERAPEGHAHHHHHNEAANDDADYQVVDEAWAQSPEAEDAVEYVRVDTKVSVEEADLRRQRMVRQKRL